MGKGDSRRSEDTDKVRENWPFVDKFEKKLIDKRKKEENTNKPAKDDDKAL
jgi:hypothetical protein